MNNTPPSPTTNSNRPTLRFIAALCVAAALFTSCGVAADAVSIEGDAAVSAANAGSENLSDSDVCDLLSDEFVEGLLGAGFKKGPGDGLSTASIAECDWRHPDKLEGPADLYRILIHTISPSSVDRAFNVVSEVPVAGLGDEGWRMHLGEAGGPYFDHQIKVGDSAYMIKVIETWKVGLTPEDHDVIVGDILDELLSNR